MKLKLDHTQRLNMHALLGAQRGDLDAIRALWGIQDRIMLDCEEEQAIELRRELVAGQERAIWNSSLILTPRDFEFTPAEILRLRAALEACNAYSAAADRGWLEPLLDALTRSPSHPTG